MSRKEGHIQFPARHLDSTPCSAPGSSRSFRVEPRQWRSPTQSPCLSLPRHIPNSIPILSPTYESVLNLQGLAETLAGSAIALLCLCKRMCQQAVTTFSYGQVSRRERENGQSLVTVWMSLVLGVIVLPGEADESKIFVERVENSDPEAILGKKIK